MPTTPANPANKNPYEAGTLFQRQPLILVYGHDFGRNSIWVLLIGDMPVAVAVGHERVKQLERRWALRMDKKYDLLLAVAGSG